MVPSCFKKQKKTVKGRQLNIPIFQDPKPQEKAILLYKQALMQSKNTAIVCCSFPLISVFPLLRALVQVAQGMLWAGDCWAPTAVV